MNQDTQIMAIGQLFKQELLNTSLGGLLYLESLTNLLGIHLLRHYCASNPQSTRHICDFSNSKLQRAIAYIQAHLEEDISLVEIATHLNMGQYRFSRWFKQSMGIPPYQYVLQQRVERAKRLLQKQELSLADIALECGFNSHSHLIRHFKNQVGMTPKQYRTR